MDQQSFWTLNLVRYAKIGDVDGIRTALEKDADIHYQDDSALQWACNNGNFDAAKCLLENGADPLGPAPIKCAAQNNHTDILRLLLEYGADYTSLPDAEKLRHMELLVSHKAESNQRRLGEPYQMLNGHTVIKFEGQAEKLGELCKVFDFAARTVTQSIDKHPAHPLMFDDFRNNRGEIMEAYDWLKKQGKDAPHPFVSTSARNIRRR
ncbi:MAG: hypothetical protein EP349_08680 [Alphaproteobacteria bacterium]|nr:MAG: hypothetical protein EP349_08680 [Alphaproteobacteria bacterium]